MTDSISDTAYCTQRRFRMMFPNPPTRLTPVNPYESGYTEFQLNMRRKAEILQYNKPRTISTQGNRLTRKELFSQTIRGFSPKQRAVQRATPEQLAFCDSSMNIVSSTQADVPGPSVPLFLDKSIPLYMFSHDQRNYSEGTSTSSETFVFHLFDDYSFTANTRIPIGVLEIKSITTETRKFHLQFETVDNIHEPPVLSILLNGSPIVQNTPYIYNIETTDSNYTLIGINNIFLLSDELYFYEFFLTFSQNTTVQTTSVKASEVSPI